jgi:hypothetical protein
MNRAIALHTSGLGGALPFFTPMPENCFFIDKIKELSIQVIAHLFSMPSPFFFRG